MARLPFFQFYPADWLSDPAVRALEPPVRSTYFDLLCRMWLVKGGTGRLPDDDRVLADLAGIRIDVWRKQRAALEAVLRFEGGEVFSDRQQIALGKIHRSIAERAGKSPTKVGEKSGKSRPKVREKSDFLGPESNETAALDTTEARSQKLDTRIQIKEEAEAAASPPSALPFPAVWEPSLAYAKAAVDRVQPESPTLADPATWRAIEKLVSSWEPVLAAAFREQAGAVLAEFVEYEGRRSKKRKNLKTAFTNNCGRWHDRNFWRTKTAVKKAPVVDDSYRALRERAGLEAPASPAPSHGALSLPPGDVDHHRTRIR